MARKIIIPHIILFAFFLSGFSFLNWYLTIKNEIITNNDIFLLVLSIILAYAAVFFVMRPIISKSIYKPKLINVITWLIIPLSIALPTALSQRYVEDISYRIVNIDTPDEVLVHPHERFFAIKSFYVNPKEFSVHKVVNVNSTGSNTNRKKTMQVDNYYVAPMYKDSLSKNFKVACGISYSASERIYHDMFNEDDRPRVRAKLEANLEKDFSNFNVKDVKFFELLNGSSHEGFNKQIYYEAWGENPILMNNSNRVILIPHNESFSELTNHDLAESVITIFLSLIFTIFIIFYTFRESKKIPDNK